MDKIIRFFCSTISNKTTRESILPTSALTVPRSPGPSSPRHIIVLSALMCGTKGTTLLRASEG